MREYVEVKQKAFDLVSLVESLKSSINLEKLNEEISLLEEEQAQEGFWNNVENARTVSSKLASLTKKRDILLRAISTLKDIQESVKETKEGDSEMISLISDMEDELSNECESLRHELLFSGEYDNLNCTVEIHPGAGGTESQDWASMLVRMYQRWAETNNFKIVPLSIEDAIDAGIKSATFKIIGPDAYGHLRCEKGVHRLVRISPFNAQGKRMTSFASVNVIPEFGAISDIVIDPKDLRVDTFRSGGAGGQNVNKVSSAVRITHIPTGIVVQCETERSQLFNKETCMSMLADRLMQRKIAEREAKLKGIVGEQKNIEWGNQIRSYVFQPYTMVKDLRTDYSTGDVLGVMDGDLNQFIFSCLEYEAKHNEKI